MTPDDRLLSIGELSRTSGLTVSALRFYDREGVLVPAEVDGATGYRRYSPGQVRSARLLAGMRRVQVPVAEMVAVLEAGGDTDAAEDLLLAHLSRLERGLEDARREVDRLRRVVRGQADGPGMTLAGPELVRALSSVRYAAGTDPDYPVLGGVLLDRDEEGVRAVATDRYRLAVARVLGAPGGAPGSVLLPVTLVDRLLATRPRGDLTVTAGRESVHVRGPDLDLSAVAVAGDYPDYRALLPLTRPAAGGLAVPEVRAALEGVGDPRRVRVHHSGAVSDGERTPSEEPGAGEVLVDAAYLWDALNAVEDGHLILPGAGTIGPLAVRSADETVLTLVMPLRETAP